MISKFDLKEYLLSDFSNNPYHLQKEHFKNLREALDYIDHHEEWFIDNKMKK